MFVLIVESMKFTDRALIDHLKNQAHDDKVHVIVPDVANQLGVGLSTVYRAINRLMIHGYLERVAGNKRRGYIYHIRN